MAELLRSDVFSTISGRDKMRKSVVGDSIGMGITR